MKLNFSIKKSIMNKFLFLFLIISIAFSCSTEKQQQTLQQDKIEAYKQLLEKYGFDELYKEDWDKFAKEIEGLDFDLATKEKELQQDIVRMEKQLAAEKAAYTKFVEAKTDEERKEVIRNNCSFFTYSMCDDLDTRFRLSSHIYSQAKADYYKNLLDNIEGMTATEVWEYSLENF